MTTIEELRTQAAQLMDNIRKAKQGKPLPAPSTDVDAERSLMLAHLADDAARERVAQALQKEHAALLAEIAQRERVERERQIATLDADITERREVLAVTLQAAIDATKEIQSLENRRYATAGIPHHSSFGALSQQLAQLAFASLNVELRR